MTGGNNENMVIIENKVKIDSRFLVQEFKTNRSGIRRLVDDNVEVRKDDVRNQSKIGSQEESSSAGSI